MSNCVNSVYHPIIEKDDLCTFAIVRMSHNPNRVTGLRLHLTQTFRSDRIRAVSTQSHDG